MLIDFDFEIEMHYHPENMERFADREESLEDFEETEDIHTACVELAEIEAIEASIN